MLLLLDNYDSFTYNLYQLMTELGAAVEVIRNDVISVAELSERKYQGIIISPGPGVPSEAGISEEVVRELGKDIPILGVCLGHQAIGEVFGGRVISAGDIIHGKASPIKHDGKGLYVGIEQATRVARYHSLIIDRASLPDCLMVTSELDDGMIMGLRHRSLPIEGIQFHPESILTPAGKQMMRNYLYSINVIKG